jgi:hypothetical protein
MRRGRETGAGRLRISILLAFHTLTGQHRALGSGISKVQSLKLDTSVWSNEIVQVRGLKREKGGEVEGGAFKKSPSLGTGLGCLGTTECWSLALAPCHPAVVHCPGK